MNLDKFDTKSAAQAGAFMQLYNPIDQTELVDEQTGEPVGLTLLGADSKEYNQARHNAAAARLDRATRSGRVKLSPQELDEEGLKCLIAVTTGVHHIEANGEQYSTDPKSLRKLYTDFPWIREQAEAFVPERGNFLGK